MAISIGLGTISFKISTLHWGKASRIGCFLFKKIQNKLWIIYKITIGEVNEEFGRLFEKR